MTSVLAMRTLQIPRRVVTLTSVLGKQEKPRVLSEDGVLALLVQAAARNELICTPDLADDCLIWFSGIIVTSIRTNGPVVITNDPTQMAELMVIACLLSCDGARPLPELAEVLQFLFTEQEVARRGIVHDHTPDGHCTILVI